MIQNKEHLLSETLLHLGLTKEEYENSKKKSNSDAKHIYRYLLLHAKFLKEKDAVRNPRRISMVLGLNHATILNSLKVVSNAMEGYNIPLKEKLLMVVLNIGIDSFSSKIFSTSNIGSPIEKKWMLEITLKKLKKKKENLRKEILDIKKQEELIISQLKQITPGL